MKRLPTFLALALVGTVVIIALSPFARVHLIRQALADAQSLIASGRPDLALRALDRTADWTPAYPPLAIQSTQMSIRALTHDRQFDAAAKRAEWLRSTRTLAPGGDRSTGIWDKIRLTTDQFCFQFLAKRGRTVLPFTWDPWAGYEVMANELAAMGESDALVSLARRAVQMDERSPLQAVLTGTPPRTRQAAAAPAPGRATAGTPRPPNESIQQVEQLRRLDAALAENSTDIKARRERNALLSKIGPTWGIVKVEQASVFDAAAAMSGQARTVARLPQGAPVDIQRYLAPGRQTMVLTRAPNGTRDERVLRLADLAIRPGALQAVSAEEQELWGQLIRVQTRYAKVKTRHSEDLSKTSPEVVRYRTARARYTEFYARMKELLAKSKKGGGDGHVVRDELRKMNYEQARVDEEYTSAKERFIEWKKQNADRLSSPELDAAKQELADLKSRIQAVSGSGR